MRNFVRKNKKQAKRQVRFSLVFLYIPSFFVANIFFGKK